jgi:hypothetical protein
MNQKERIIAGFIGGLSLIAISTTVAVLGAAILTGAERQKEEEYLKIEKKYADKNQNGTISKEESQEFRQIYEEIWQAGYKEGKTHGF